ncbi:MAG: CvpA family protein [Piscinibacter sp.]|nr:CvpA family protein [Piscinibacter sp.]
MDVTSVSWVDLVLAAVLLISVVIGLWRGVVFEVLSLLGWVAAWFAAQWFAPQVAQWLPVGAPGSALNLGAAFALTFIGALIAWTLAARLIRLLLHATPLSLVDRLLGAVFGVLRGVVLLLALAVVVGLTPWAKSSSWQQARGAAWLTAALHGLTPLLPPQVARHLPVA